MHRCRDHSMGASVRRVTSSVLLDTMIGELWMPDCRFSLVRTRTGILWSSKVAFAARPVSKSRQNRMSPPGVHSARARLDRVMHQLAWVKRGSGELDVLP